MTGSLTPSLRRRSTGWLVPVVAVVCAGCSRSGPALYAVRGKVLFEGQPARGATLVLHPLGNSGANAIKPRAFVDRDGGFEVFTYAAGDGAPAGEYAVTVLGRIGPGPGAPGRRAQAGAKQGRGFPAGLAMKRGPGFRPPGAGKGAAGMPPQRAGRRGPGAPPGGGWGAELPTRYQRPETSNLRITVQPGDNVLEPLLLKK
ncbi:MAG TPA: hypothetical protein VG099_09225, partial [Gemmataceae bacterium]|nr:hypothetical protein [Gemmataceae bacterium]